MLILNLGVVAEGEGRRLSDALKAFRESRGLDAPFLVVSTTAPRLSLEPSRKDGRR